MNSSPALLCIVAMFALNTLSLVCYFIERRDHLREVAELTARAEAPTRYMLSSFTATGAAGPRFVSEKEIMDAYLKQLSTTLSPGTTATLLRIRR